MNTLSRSIPLLVLLLVLLHLVPSAASPRPEFNFEDSRHDLAVYARAAAAGETGDTRCLVCHPPPVSTLAPGLWAEGDATYLLDFPYDRPGEESVPGKPDGSSLVCLGCHDGTIATGDILSRSQSMRSETGISRTDLSDGHPVSVPYDPRTLDGGGGLRSADRLPGSIRLDARNKIQCTTCHDPHDDTYGNFLVIANGAGALCVACHRKPNWQSSPHNTSTAAWNYTGQDPWPFTESRGTVAEHACANCHTPHTAGNGRYLLNYASEEDNCLGCHNGSVAATDIASDFAKVSHHPVETVTGIHRADEPVSIPAADRHVECADCHEPHSASVMDESGYSSISANVDGVDVNGGEKAEIAAEFELCFRCHGDRSGVRGMPTPRVHDQANVRLQFDNSNPSFHPVVGPGNNPDVPSLIAPYSENSTITCGDCHASDADSRLGGQGPDGPHGSIYASLLIRNYKTQDQTPESPGAYALCYSCHDRNSILGDESFPYHRLHVGDNRAPCSVCHDPHGISYTQGDPIGNSHLINFDSSVVVPDANDDLRFEDRGYIAGACYLACHNTEHDGWSY